MFPLVIYLCTAIACIVYIRKGSTAKTGYGFNERILGKKQSFISNFFVSSMEETKIEV